MNQQRQQTADHGPLYVVDKTGKGHVVDGEELKLRKVGNGPAQGRGHVGRLHRALERQHGAAGDGVLLMQCKRAVRSLALKAEMEPIRHGFAGHVVAEGEGSGQGQMLGNSVGRQAQIQNACVLLINGQP